jgi:hypothetical protein
MFDSLGAKVPQQNRKVERKFQTFYGKIRARLGCMGFRDLFRSGIWADCAWMAEEGQISPISVEHVNQALSAVTETVFLHQELETQRLWMNRKMFKPV